MALTTRATRQPKKEAPKPPRPPVHKKPHDPGLSPGSSKLAALQRTLGNQAVARRLQREDVDPTKRDALLPVAKQLMEQGAQMALSAVPMASQLMSAPVNVPGVTPGADPSSAAAQGILANLTAAGTLLDSGIATFQQAGGKLVDIEHMLRLRVRVSNAIFWLQQMVAGNPSAGPLAAQELIGIPVEWAMYQAGEAIKVVKTLTSAFGPPTEAEALQAQVKGAVLKVLLVPLGSAPIPL